MAVDPQRTWTLAEHVTWKPLEDSIVILDLDSGSYYTLNASAALFWRCIAEGSSFEQGLNTCLETYDVDRNKLVADLTRLTSEMESEKIIA